MGGFGGARPDFPGESSERDHARLKEYEQVRALLLANGAT
jgi:hypothetical protein